MPKPTVKVDWLTFTVWRELGPSKDYDLPMMVTLRSVVGLLHSIGVTVEIVPTGKSRRPYTDAYQLDGLSGVLMTNKKLKYATLEFTGQGCSQLHAMGELEKVIGFMDRNNQKPTRFDVAIDFVVKDRPKAFVDAGYSSRIKTYGYHKTSTGETVYLGSPKSDMMCRVYRYDEPHPRADKLRIELVARREKAEDALRIWREDGPNACVAFMAKRYKFDAAIWQDVELDVWSVETSTEALRSDGKTIIWLLGQVKAALLKLALADKLSPDFWHRFFDGIPNITVTYSKGPDDLEPLDFPSK